MRNSIAFKIFGIVFVVTLVMSAISLFNMRIAIRASEHMERVINLFLESYGAIARLNVRSLEQAVQLRDYELLAGRSRGDAKLADNYRKDLTRLSDQFGQELARARTLIAAELNAESGFTNVAWIARVDERLKHIEAEQREFEIRQKQRMLLVASGARTPPAAFAEHQHWRSEFNRLIEDTRVMMLESTRDAGAILLADQKRARTISLALLALVGLMIAVLSILFVRQLAQPVRRLLEGTRAVAAGNLDLQLPVTSSDEIGRLTKAFNQMIIDLLQGRQARDTFGKYVDPRIVKSLIDSPLMGGLAGERRVMTIMFCDVKGFTGISESMTPTGLVAVINRYFTLMSEAVRENEGVIDKFIGDAVMAYWGVPFVADGDQARLALQSAVLQLEKIRLLQEELPELLRLRHNLPQIEIRIGIATGDVLVGSIGSDLMRNFTVMGDAVNLASRLESANNVYGTSTLVSEETARRAGNGTVLREIDSLRVIGQKQPVRVFEVMGLADTFDPARLHLREHYERGLAAYRERRWDEALDCFAQALAIRPDDGPSRVFTERANRFRAEPPPADWDGTWIMAEK